MIILVLISLGLCFGSFVNALVWRLREQQKTRSKKRRRELSIISGHSMCVHCHHRLAARDLLPVLSWILLRGKCRYCRGSIAWQYPLVETLTALLFVASYVFWPQPIVTGWALLYFVGWLVCLVGFMALVVYDLRWMLLPNRIIFPLYGVAAIMVMTLVLHDRSLEPLRDALFGILIGGGIFYFLFQISGGRWIGGGDVKLGFLLGALAGGPTESLMMLFFASLLGTTMILPLLATRSVSRQTRIPFGPFLIVAAIIVQLFGQRLLEWYLDSLV